MDKLVIIGNGFDLAHGLKTGYKHFIDWYMSQAFSNYIKSKNYKDALIEIKSIHGMTGNYSRLPLTAEEVISYTNGNLYQKLEYHSNFFNEVLSSFHNDNWVDIERFYFQELKRYFKNSQISNTSAAIDLNKEFDYIIHQLATYIKTINQGLENIPQIDLGLASSPLNDLFVQKNEKIEIKYLNFNYTETMTARRYAIDDDIIYIHGRVADMDNNPIIFGYGDESDPDYQNIEDSGENKYLEHIKSFGYFRTGNYHKLLSYIDTRRFTVHIVGHSCGLSDRVLLNQIFEHENCETIEIFYHKRKDGTDNFKEITQEISRHFKPANKNLMRRKILAKNIANVIPQRSSNT